MSPDLSVAVLGQGLAGTLVSARLRERGVAHVVIDRGHVGSSSHAAAGLVNPVTGRRFVLVEGYADYVARFGIYERLGRLLSGVYLQPLTIYRDLSRAEDRNRWDLRRATPAYAPYLGAPITADQVDLPRIDSSLWLGPTSLAHRVDVPGLICAYRTFCREAGDLLEVEAQIEVRPRPGSRLELAGRAFDVVIDCRGAACASTEAWRDRSWRLSKGESIVAKRARWPRSAATKLGGRFVAPLGPGQDVWYGGTSTDHYDDGAPTQAFLAEAKNYFSKSPPSEFDHRAGVRPTTTDRRAVVGAHASIGGLYICNGLGTRGALTAPSLSAEVLSILPLGLAARR